MNSNECMKIISILQATYPRQMTPQAADIYSELLSDLSYKAVSIGLKAVLLTSGEFMPRIGEIRAACAEYRDGTHRNGGDAWGDVRKAIRKYGVYRTPVRELPMVCDSDTFVFEDPLIYDIINSLGWRVVCNVDEDDSAFRARFIQLYDQHTQAAIIAGKLQGALPAPSPKASGLALAYGTTQGAGGPLSVGAAIAGLLTQHGDQGRKPK